MTEHLSSYLISRIVCLQIHVKVEFLWSGRTSIFDTVSKDFTRGSIIIWIEYLEMNYSVTST